MFGDFFEIILDWVSSSWLWLQSSLSVKNVARIEAPKMLTRVEPLTRFTLSLDQPFDQFKVNLLSCCPGNPSNF